MEDNKPTLQSIMVSVQNNVRYLNMCPLVNMIQTWYPEVASDIKCNQVQNASHMYILIFIYPFFRHGNVTCVTEDTH